MCSIFLFCLPVTLPVDPTTMNYASVVFAGFASISVVYYFVNGRKNFKGPPVIQDADPADIGVARGQSVVYTAKDMEVPTDDVSDNEKGAMIEGYGEDASIGKPH